MNAHTDIALRSLDAAAADLTPGEQERAQTTLERIVATTPAPHAWQPADPAPAPPSRRRLVLVPTAVLALIVGSVLVQGGRGGDAAYASWTATPSSVSSDDLEVAASACNDQLRRWAGDGTGIDPDKARLALAERRGDHVALLYRTDDPDNSTACLLRNPQGSTDVDNLEIGAGGSSGPALAAPARGYTQGMIGEFDGASITDGAVGHQVTGVTIHAGSLTVKATVDNGRYTAWWPGPAFSSGPVEPSGEGGPESILTYDLTLTDGTVIHNAQPTRPS